MPDVEHSLLNGESLHADKRIKDDVIAASVANITLSSPGSTIDGVTMTSGDRFLAKDQSTGSQNGIYIFNGSASAATRATDADAAAEFYPGFKVYVRLGTVNASSYWTFTTAAAVTLGSTSLAFGRDILASSSVAGEISAVDFYPTGLTGATSTSRYVGGTASVAPSTGTFAVGDYVISQIGTLWICTVAGSPGGWTQVNGSVTPTGKGSAVLISQVTPTGTTFNFSSIPTGFRNLRITGATRKSTTSSGILRMRFNSDTGANYTYEHLFNDSNVETIQRSVDQTSGYVADVPGSDALANARTYVLIEIPDYIDTTSHKGYFTRGLGNLGAATSAFTTDRVGGTWTATPAAIGAITLLLSAGNFTNATFTLWGEAEVPLQSTTAPALATSGTITTTNISAARVAPAGAVTGVILQAGTFGGQEVMVVNESTGANSITFAASGTSHVADGTSSVIAGLTARTFVYDSSTSLWYACK